MLMERQFCCRHGDQVISSHSLHNRNNSTNNNNNSISISMFPSSSSSSSSSSSIFLPISSPPPSHLHQSSSSSSSSPAFVGGGGGGHIEHVVSKFDTLAGVAIKYGVEVADIKKMNGLVTDLQMFGLRFLQIPLPGRHPPSPCLSNDSKTPPPGQSSSDQTPPRSTQRDLFESFQPIRVTPQRKASPAMNSLQSYYGLKPRNKNSMTEDFEMAVYRNGGAHCLEDGPVFGASPAYDQPLNHYRKSRSLVMLDENSELSDSMPAETFEGDSDQLGEKLIRRRQKSEADFSRTPEMLLGDNSGSGSGGFSAIKGKGLALRPKAANRSAVGQGTDVESAGGLNPIPVGLGDSLIAAEGFSGVRKSSSTSNLQDHDGGGSSASIWSTSKWSLKPDLQAFSTAAIAKPIFDGLPKPITGRRKAAID